MILLNFPYLEILPTIAALLLCDGGSSLVQQELCEVSVTSLLPRSIGQYVSRDENTCSYASAQLTAVPLTPRPQASSEAGTWPQRFDTGWEQLRQFRESR